MADEQQPPNGGGEPVEVTGEQIFELQAQLLCAMAPGATIEAARAAMQKAYAMELNLEKVYKYLFEGQEPRWALYLVRANKDGPPLFFGAPKSMGGQLTGADVRNYALIVGALTSPVVRGLLVLTGWSMTIGPVVEKPAPKIIL